MYPLDSLLRRSSVSVVYVREDQCRINNNRKWVPTLGTCRFIDLVERTWSTGPDIPMFQMASTAEDPVERALRLSRKETEIAAHLRLKDQIYTLLVGPESSSLEGRTITIGIARGVFRWSGNRLRPLSTNRKVVLYRR